MKPTLILLFSVLLCVPPGKAQVEPTGKFEYARRLLPEGAYDPSVPTPESVLTFEVGDRAAFPSEILAVFRALDEASPKATLFEYANTHEGRPLVYMAVSSAANIDRIDEIKKGLARLGDPRGLSEAAGRELLASLPATAWLAYSIHGDETSGADAAMLVAYHLVASQSETTRDWLEDIVILIDPMMNPDGRHRFLSPEILGAGRREIRPRPVDPISVQVEEVMVRPAPRPVTGMKQRLIIDIGCDTAMLPV